MRTFVLYGGQVRSVGSIGMKKLFSRLLLAIVVFVLLSGMTSALAVGTGVEFSGHWAQETMERALSDSLIADSESAVKPDAALTGADMVTILCRIFSTGKSADLSAVSDISKDDPYYKAASQAVAMGFISPLNGRLNLSSPVTRGGAFTALAEAFQLTGAKPDTSWLKQYTDSGELNGIYRTAAAALTSGGYVRGNGQALHINDSISLAEFLTVLYRIIPNYQNAPASNDSAKGGTVISGNPAIYGQKLTDNVYIDCSSTGVSLQNSEIPGIVLRCDKLNALNIYSSKIDRLVLAAGSGDVSYSPDNSSSVGAVIVGDGGGTVTLGGTLPNIEITGNGRNVVITGSVKNLSVSGSNCTVTLDDGATADVIQILSAGAGNKLTVNGSCAECDIFGVNTSVAGSGLIQKVVDNTSGSSLTVKAADTVSNKNYGLTGAKLSMNAPDGVPSYVSLDASVDIAAPASGNACIGRWYIDGVLVSQADITLGTTKTASLSYAATNTGETPITVRLSFVLSFEDPDGGTQELRADRNVVLEPGNKFDLNEVMSLVTTGYNGDFTLKWAQSHDYDSALKVAWINGKGYSSKTQYLVWVNITYQRVNVFSGSAGNWKLEKTFIVGTGAPGKDTPVGIFKVIGRTTYGWTTKAYTVKPVVNFNTYAYGFHSRLYYPNTTKILDSRIGFPISHGCVRMYDEDVAWMYENIPTGTTVVVF
jgi:lipoprotein-anchoring transpeptidase ErfK/SrfK